MNRQNVFSADRMPTLAFRGTREAELFTREIAASFAAVLAKNYVSVETDTMPAGFVSASVDGRPCSTATPPPAGARRRTAKPPFECLVDYGRPRDMAGIVFNNACQQESTELMDLQVLP